ncbi:MAG: FtsH protease activity modulator HflK [Clostridiales bacterium]|nr:FtsH protease activity modulator HflK [Clostridiales bacterium]
MSFYDQNSPFQGGRKPNIGKLKKYLVAAVVIVLLLIAASTCWFTVNNRQLAVVTTFGKVTSIKDAGMHFKLPFGIQKVYKVDANVYQKIEIGYRTDYYDSSQYTVVENESKMITGDYNIVNVDFYVEYKVSDPVKYLFGSYEPEKILKNLVQSQFRNVIGSTEVDRVLTDGKSEIEMKAKELVKAVLSEYDIGLMMIDLKIQDSEPPTPEVNEAFKAVETAKQGAETAINDARAYANAELPKAQAEADKLIQNAEYLKQNRINEAKQQVAMFEAMYREYALNPDITRSRMYYEAITDVLPGVKLYIDASEGGTQKLLPIESFVDGSAKSGAERTIGE